MLLKPYLKLECIFLYFFYLFNDVLDTVSQYSYCFSIVFLLLNVFWGGTEYDNGICKVLNTNDLTKSTTRQITLCSQILII